MINDKKNVLSRIKDVIALIRSNHYREVYVINWLVIALGVKKQI